MALVELLDVTKHFRRGSGPTIHAVNGVSMSIDAGRTVALIGESGSGKSTMARLALRLHDPTSGTVRFDGQDIAALDREAVRRLRSRMTMVFQEPRESLDPRQTVQDIVAEPLRVHERGLSRAQRQARVFETLDQVALSRSFAGRYRNELSGGQQQRVGIARAIVTRPDFIALDEPTASLDLSVRAQILELLAQLRSELGLAYLFVSHDLPTVEYVADEICVMYLGQIVERGPAADLVADPQHPYTRALLSATLSVDPDDRRVPLRLVGQIPSTTALPTGCFLHGRCPLADDECARGPVALHAYTDTHDVACRKSGPRERADAGATP